MALTEGTMIKKHHVALFLNTGTTSVPVWQRIAKSTDNTISMNPETKTFDYIVDESPTEEVDRVKPSLSQPITMYKGRAEYEFMFNKFFSQAVGDEAHGEVLIVFYGADVGSSYQAWKSDCVFIIDNMNPVESTITANINFNGTTEKGIVTITSGVPVFTSDVVTEFLSTVNVKYDSDNVENATVIVNGVSKKTNASGNVSFSLIDGEDYVIGASDGTHEASDIFKADSETATINLILV